MGTVRGMLCCGVAVMTAGLASASPTWAAAPGNDTRAQATAIVSGDVLTGTLEEATSAPDPTAGFDAGSAATNERNVWYRFAAPGSGTWSLDICGPLTGARPTISVWTAGAVVRRTTAEVGLCDDGSRNVAAFTTDGAETIDFLVSDQNRVSDPDSSFSVRLRPGPNTEIVSTGSSSNVFTTPWGDTRLSLRSRGTPVVDITCAIDGGASRTCNSSSSVRDLAAGEHTVAAAARDGSGTSDPSPLNTTFTIDRTPPQTTINDVDVTDPAAPTIDYATSDDSGSSFGECAVGALPYSACDGFVAVQYSGLCAGTRTLRVRASDAAGNLDPTPESRDVTTPAGGDPCGAPQGRLIVDGGTQPFLAVDTNGRVTSAYVEYGRTSDYGFRTVSFLFGENLADGALAAKTSGVPLFVFDEINKPMHLRLVLTDETGAVQRGEDVVFTPTVSPGTLLGTLEIGDQIATQTSVDVPYTFQTSAASPFVATQIQALVVNDARAGFAGAAGIADLGVLPAGIGARPGVIRLEGLEPDSRYELLLYAVAPGGSAFKGMIAAETLPVPVPTPDPTPVPATPNPEPAATPAVPSGTPAPVSTPAPTRARNPLGRLKLPKKLSLKLLKARKLRPQLGCTAACSLRIRLLKGKVVVASGTARRTRAGTSSVTLKPTKAGLKAIRKVKRGKRLKLSLVAAALDAKGKPIGSIKRSVSLR